jgi:hypothetical protein
MTLGWKDRYLWICHEAHIEEGMFLGPEERRMVDHHGRISEMKTYFREQMKKTVAMMRDIESRNNGRTVLILTQLEEQEKKLRKVMKAVSKAGGSLDESLCQDLNHNHALYYNAVKCMEHP